MPLARFALTGPGLGARVTGFTAQELHSDIAVRSLIHAVLERGLLVVEGQSPATLQALSEVIGSAEVVLPVEHRYPGSVGLRLQSTRPGVGVDGGGAYWHADGSWLPQPMDVTLLNCIQAPSEGGTTAFVDAAALYDSFDGEFREFINGLVGIFPNRAVLKADLDAMGLQSREMLDRTVDAVHPTARVHPYTGRHALIVNEMWMSGIAGMSEQAAELVLQDLVDRVESSPCRYIHHWTAGDLLIWDNHRVLHKAAPVPAGSTKTTVRARVPQLARRWLV